MSAGYFVRILRSLCRRSGARIEPLFMGPVTHERFLEHGQPLSSEERARLSQVVRGDDPSAPCHDLLKTILRAGTWIEQEQFSDECVAAAMEG